MDIIVLCVRLWLALLFGVAAASKIGSAPRFLDVLVNLGIKSHNKRKLIGLAVVLAELTLSLMFLFDISVQRAGLFGAALLLSFSGILAVRLGRGKALPDCGCGLTARPATGRSLARNAGLIVVCLSFVWPTSLVPLLSVGAILQVLSSIPLSSGTRPTNVGVGQRQPVP